MRLTEIRHNETNTSGMFTAWLDGNQAGEMTYLRQKATQQADTMIINHTQVFDGFEGQGIARQMVMAAVDFARSNNRKITPVCSYAAAVLSRTDEYKDIL